MTMAADVKKGAKYLDKTQPGWASKIKKKKLKMDSNSLCVLGQLTKMPFSNAIKFAEHLGIYDRLEELGFECQDSELADEHATLWIKEVDKRLQNADEDRQHLDEATPTKTKSKPATKATKVKMKAKAK